jgi:hypothetical protein
MCDLRSIFAVALAATLVAAANGALALDEARYPDLKGEWRGTGGNKWPTPAPLTPEYQAIFEANLRDQATGIHDSRRIYTDGRDWPQEMEPMFSGYSIGKWIDQDSDGRYDLLTVETRGLKGPRTFDSTGIPMHKDNQTVVKERIYLDKSDANLLHNEITTIDHALTGPWTITKNYRRTVGKKMIWWRESICAENNPHVRIGKEIYYVGADGNLMPAKKDQPPPDLKYFKQSQKR